MVASPFRMGFPNPSVTPSAQNFTHSQRDALVSWLDPNPVKCAMKNDHWTKVGWSYCKITSQSSLSLLVAVKVVIWGLDCGHRHTSLVLPILKDSAKWFAYIISFVYPQIPGKFQCPFYGWDPFLGPLISNGKISLNLMSNITSIVLSHGDPPLQWDCFTCLGWKEGTTQLTVSLWLTSTDTKAETRMLCIIRKSPELACASRKSAWVNVRVGSKHDAGWESQHSRKRLGVGWIKFRASE